MERPTGTLEVSLIQWPNGEEAGGAVLLGRIDDPDLVEAVLLRVREHLQAELDAVVLPEEGLRIVKDGDL